MYQFEAPFVLMFCSEEPAGSLSRSWRSWSRSWPGGSATPTEKTQLLKKNRKGRGYSLFLLHALWRNLGLYFLCGTLCLLLHDAFMFAVPQVLRWVREITNMLYVMLY